MTLIRPHDHDLRIATLAEMGASSPQPLGIRVFVDEDRAIYINVGRSTDEIAQLLKWEERGIWMPGHVFAYVREEHPVIVDPIAATNQLIMHPDAICRDDRNPDGRIFIVEGSRLHDTGLLLSRSVRYVDGIIEDRPVSGGSVLRIFHLSPRSRRPRGEQLWP